MAANAYQQYQESQVFTASRGRLLLMAYDGAMRFIRQAQAFMADRNYEGQNTSIVKAQRIILSLASSLDHTADPDLAERLTRLYEYLFSRLIHANVSDDPEALSEVISHLAGLREAWAEADRSITCAQIPVEASHAVALAP